MAKNPIYKYQYKPQAVTYFKPKLDDKANLAKSVGSQVTNLEQRFQNVGIPTATGAKEVDQRNIIEKALNLKANQGVLMDILEVLNRPTQVVTNILSSLGDQDKRNVLQAAWEGLSGQKEIGARQALANLTGDPNILKINPDPNTKWDDIGQFIVDLGLEIAVDPTTYLGVPGIKQAITEPIEGAIKAGAKTVLGKVDEAAKALTRKALYSLPNDVARKAITGIRGLRNLATKTGHLFDAMKDVGVAMRGELDKVFGTSSSKLRLLKERIFALDKEIETSIGTLSDVSKANFTQKVLDEAVSKRTVAEQALAVAQKQVDDLSAGLKAARSTPNNLKQVAKISKELDAAKSALRVKRAGFDKLSRVADKISDIIKNGSKKYYREALFELYEAGFKVSKDGKFLFDIANAPRSSLKFKDVIETIFKKSDDMSFKSRKIAGEKVEKVYKDVKKIVSDVNDAVGKDYLTVDILDDYLTINLSVPESDLLTPLAASADRKEIIAKYKSALERATEGSKKGLFIDLDLGKTPLSKEARDILALGGEKVGKIFNTIDDVVAKADDLMTSTTTGFKYQKEALYKGQLPDSTRYLRRVKTEEFVKKLREGTKYEALPALKEVVSSTGKELTERVYKGTAREYNDVMRLFYNATTDEFSQDLVRSLTDYVRVAESRFTMSEIARIVFGLDVTGQEDVLKPVQKTVRKGGKVVEEGIDLVPTGKTRLTFGEGEFSQADQFMMPVDEIVNPDKPFTMGIEAVTQRAPDGKVIGIKSVPTEKLNRIRSEVVTKEMARQFEQRYPSFKILDDGFAYLDSAGEIAGGEFSNLVKSLPKELQKEVITYLKQNNMLGKKMAVHRSAYEMLKNAQNAYKTNLNASIGLFDKFLGKWKELTLLSPSFHIRNWIGNWSNMSLAGMNPAEIVDETGKAWQQISKREELLRKAATGTLTAQEQFMLKTIESPVSGLAAARRGVRDLEELAAARKFDTKLEEKLSGSFGKQYDTLVKWNFQMSERADEVQRLAMYNWGIKKGLSPAESIQKVREVLFDYGNLTSFEKNVMKRFFPFYTFIKENLAFQFKNGLKNTGRYKDLFRTYKHYLEEVVDVDPNDLPKYMTGNMWLPLPFTVNKNDKEAISFLKLNLPVADFVEFVEDPLKKVTSSIAVPIKASWEFLSGVDTFTGEKVKKFPGEKSVYRGPAGVLDFLRNEKGEFDISRDPTIKKFVDDLGLRTVRRPLTLLLDSIDTIMGKKNPADAALSLFEQTGFITTKTREEIDLTSLYQKLEYLRNLKKLYEQSTGGKLPTLAESAGYKFKPQ